MIIQCIGVDNIRSICSLADLYNELNRSSHMSLRIVGGDYVFKNCRLGSLRNIGWDMSLRNVGGDYVFKNCRRGSLRNVGGDYVLMKCRGDNVFKKCRRGLCL